MKKEISSLPLHQRNQGKLANVVFDLGKSWRKRFLNKSGKIGILVLIRENQGEITDF